MTDNKLEVLVANLLRVGVTAAGLVVAAGGLLFLGRHGGEQADYHKFIPLNASDRLLPDILSAAAHYRARSIIQAGILLLIATPILRVAVSLVGFALERDLKYVAITSIVLAILLFSLFSSSFLG